MFINGYVGRVLAGSIALGGWLVSPVLGACPEKSAQVNVSVSAENKISIPAAERSVTIELDQEAAGKTKVCWVIHGLKEGYTLQLQQKPETEGSGYFDFDMTVDGKPNAVTLDRTGVPLKAGKWVYAVKLDGPGEVSDVLDPEVIINPGPGGSGGDESEMRP